jgi:hypothetical protein
LADALNNFSLRAFAAVAAQLFVQPDAATEYVDVRSAAASNS